MKTPVLLITFNRPKYTKEVLAALKTANVKNLYVFKDGPRPFNNDDKVNSKEIENLDLIKQIYDYLIIEFNNFSIQKIKGHVGHPGNEFADAIATNNGAKIATFMRENKDMFDCED